jgi:hypothetical protein
MDYKDRTQRVESNNWVLVDMRDYESNTRHHKRKGDIRCKYSDQDSRRLIDAGILPSRAEGHGRQAPSVVFVHNEISSTRSSRRCDFNQSHPETPTSDEEEEEEAVPASAVLLRGREDDLPSPATPKKRGKSSSLSCCASSNAAIGIDFHHEVGWVPGPPPACTPPTITILARVKFWCPDKEVGYATPLDKKQTKQGVDVCLTAQCVAEAELKQPLRRDDIVKVTIDPTHVRPKVLPGGLKRATKGG